ncbi:MAG: hypothetical protein FJ128_07465 [Deltaproteobacteria bacterium]|nr:hypothetical protein [Deltaproteobacteria bacterium]
MIRIHNLLETPPDLPEGRLLGRNFGRAAKKGFKGFDKGSQTKSLTSAWRCEKYHRLLIFFNFRGIAIGPIPRKRCRQPRRRCRQDDGLSHYSIKVWRFKEVEQL